MAVLREGKLLAAGRPDELGARLWRGLAVDLELGGQRRRPVARVPAAAWPASTPPRRSPAAHACGCADRDAIPQVVAALVGREVPVYGAVPRPPTLEDVYFATHRRTRSKSADELGP